MGAILVFWYWYKKYERDKEVDMIKYYSEKYKRERARGYAWVLNLWYEEFYLRKKWYISKDLWEEWDYWIKEDIKEFYESDFDRFFYDYDLNQDWEESISMRWDFYSALEPFGERLFLNKKEQLEKKESIGEEFCKYLIEGIGEYFEWKKNRILEEHETINDLDCQNAWLAENRKLFKSELLK